MTVVMTAQLVPHSLNVCASRKPHPLPQQRPQKMTGKRPKSNPIGTVVAVAVVVAVEEMVVEAVAQVKEVVRTMLLCCSRLPTVKANSSSREAIVDWSAARSSGTIDNTRPPWPARVATIVEWDQVRVIAIDYFGWGLDLHRRIQNPRELFLFVGKDFPPMIPYVLLQSIAFF
jgi:hypothetical protein